MSGTVIKVGSEAELNQAIASVDAATSGSFDVQFTSDITEGTDAGTSIAFGNETLSAPPDLYGVNLHSGVALTIDGGGNTLDGANAYRGFFIYAGSVAIDNLTIADAVATGGNADAGFGSAAGGGAGLGGGLFVAGTANVDGYGNTLITGGSVALDGVSFLKDSAVGGSGGSGGINTDAGGGGGMGGAGGSPGSFTNPTGGGGGGIGVGAVGGGDTMLSGGTGIVLGAAGGGAGDLGSGGGFGGGGGVGRPLGGGGGVGGHAAGPGSGRGGFGGGGGGGDHGGGRGGFGGGGGGGDFRHNGGFGGFGGGGGGGGYDGGQGGFGGGAGGAPDPQYGGVASGGGGAGLGAGGGIFIQQGGALSIEGGSFTAGEVHGGAGGASGPLPGTGGASGAGLGSGLFLQGNQSVTLDPQSGQTLTIGDEITDQSNSGGSGRNAGAGGLVIAGAGVTKLTRANGFTGGTTLTSGTLDLAAVGAAGRGGITFAASDPILQIDSTVMPTNTITGFITGDTIDLTGISFDATDTVSYSGTTFSIQNSLGTTLASLTLTGKPYTAANFFLSNDARTGTDITTDVLPCFTRGTRIRTERGEVNVEELRVGDRAVTAAGAVRPIVWVGERLVECRRHPRPELVYPVRVGAHAFAENQPRRDLRLSPDHALFLDGVLVPVKYLVDGACIVQEKVARVHYFHVELDQHDIMLAEGLAAESYLDTGNRAQFANGAAHINLHPDFSALSWDDACVSLCTGGPLITAIRRRLRERVIEAAGLRVLVDGHAIRPASVRGRLLQFLLPGGTREVRIVACDEVESASENRRRSRIGIESILIEGRKVVPDTPEPAEGGAVLNLPGTPICGGRILLELLLGTERAARPAMIASCG